LPPELFAGVGNVHYTKDGYAKIAKQVAEKIKASLEGEQLDPGDKK
jgi:hypothetical protein